MKNTDFSFKLVAAAILAGVVVAFAGPTHGSKPASNVPAKPAVIDASAAVTDHATAGQTE